MGGCARATRAQPSEDAHVHVQEDSPLKIVDLLTRSVVTVKNQHFRTPSAFIFLYENQTFLAFRGRDVTVWNFRGVLPRPCRTFRPQRSPADIRLVAHSAGELVSRFEDHALWCPATPCPCAAAVHTRHTLLSHRFPLPEIDHTSVIYITQNQDVILSLCEESEGRLLPFISLASHSI